MFQLTPVRSASVLINKKFNSSLFKLMRFWTTYRFYRKKNPARYQKVKIICQTKVNYVKVRIKTFVIREILSLCAFQYILHRWPFNVFRQRLPNNACIKVFEKQKIVWNRIAKDSVKSYPQNRIHVYTVYQCKIFIFIIITTL